ncbi:unnamed protein product [Notodromas monacha]|uniref:Methyltransferase FkbM domain-containing protein n=2 Tax=Notodromas monacha TaxID=399045 RepID=A0A7R9GGU7_9CRUS|nr:unnamed protein product [Notodromas monacha]CAG0922098.1 unnamed protein product [Notodromas monacha]
MLPKKFILFCACVTFLALCYEIGTRMGFVEELCNEIEEDSVDEDLISFVRDKILIKPSIKAYNLTTIPGFDTSMNDIVSKFIIPTFFPGKKSGVFFEAGALDGEILSTSLYLERTLNWTGLLAEMNPMAIELLLAKNRKSWIAPVCLSPRRKPIKVEMNMLHDPKLLHTMWGATISAKKWAKNMKTWNHKGKVPFSATVDCYPLEALLSAANFQEIDLFSLDVEGVELQVLKTINWDNVKIKVILLDLLHTEEGEAAVAEFLQSVGFVYIRGKGAEVVYVSEAHLRTIENISICITLALFAIGVNARKDSLDLEVEDAMNSLKLEDEILNFNEQPVPIWTCLQRVGQIVRRSNDYPVLVRTGVGLSAISSASGCPQWIHVQTEREMRSAERRQELSLVEQVGEVLTSGFAMPRGDLCPKDTAQCQTGAFVIVYAYFCLSMNNPPENRAMSEWTLWVRNLSKAISDNGGIRASVYKLYRQNDLKDGKLVGEDQFGNKYYENTRYFFGRNRWVIYHPSVGVDYDGSMIPPDWYGWLHYKTDFAPTVKARVKYPWMMKYEKNLSGTKHQYTPYSTTVPKIVAWKPKSKSKD